MCGQFAFRSTTQEWDAARVSAAVPSGVGFLGSALIWKETEGEKGTPSERHSVHGLTTAASVWLSAAVGIGAGGALYLYCLWCVVLVVFVLRLGPRLVLMGTYGADDSSFQNTDTGSEWDTGEGTGPDDDGDYCDEDEEFKPLTREEQRIRLEEEAAAQVLAARELAAEQQQQLSDAAGGNDNLGSTTSAVGGADGIREAAPATPGGREGLAASSAVAAYGSTVSLRSTSGHSPRRRSVRRTTTTPNFSFRS